MIRRVSFEGIGEVAATFYADGAVKAGQTVKSGGDSTVKLCGAGERFCGVALGHSRGGCVGVQTGGFAQVKCADSTVTVGYVKLTGDGSGGVKKAGAADAGQEYWVAADDGAGTLTIML